MEKGGGGGGRRGTLRLTTRGEEGRPTDGRQDQCWSSLCWRDGTTGAGCEQRAL